MHKSYEECIKDLPNVNCEAYAKCLIKILAALAYSIDECVSEKKAEEILGMCRSLTNGLPENCNTPVS